MAKLLRIKDYIMLSGAFAADAFGEIRSGMGIMPKMLEMRYGYTPTGFKKKSYISTVASLLKVGDIEKVVEKDGNAYLQLTSSGIEKYKRKFPIFTKVGKKWDGYFMIVVFDVPEKDRVIRDCLRDKLQLLGFGMLQESVWISPYHFEQDLREFIVSEGLSDIVFVLEAKGLYLGNIKLMAEKIWNIEILRKRYSEIVSRINALQTIDEKGKQTEITDILNLFMSTLKGDPFLPNELLNTSIDREKAVNLIDSLIN